MTTARIYGCTTLYTARRALRVINTNLRRRFDVLKHIPHFRCVLQTRIKLRDSVVSGLRQKSMYARSLRSYNLPKDSVPSFQCKKTQLHVYLLPTECDYISYSPRNCYNRNCTTTRATPLLASVICVWILRITIRCCQFYCVTEPRLKRCLRLTPCNWHLLDEKTATQTVLFRAKIVTS